MFWCIGSSYCIIFCWLLYCVVSLFMPSSHYEKNYEANAHFHRLRGPWRGFVKKDVAFFIKIGEWEKRKGKNIFICKLFANRIFESYIAIAMWLHDFPKWSHCKAKSWQCETIAIIFLIFNSFLHTYQEALIKAGCSHNLKYPKQDRKKDDKSCGLTPLLIVKMLLQK